MDLKNIDVRLDEENQALILLCSLSLYFENFIKSILYDRDTFFKKMSSQLYTLKS